MFSNRSTFPIYLVAVIVAFCSIVYELLLAQTLTALLGNSILRYSVTIGLFLFSLGMGALILDLKKTKNPVRFLFQVEIILSIVGCMAPFLTFSGDAFCQMLVAKWNFLPDSTFVSMLNYLQSHIWIIVIGILSGFEIPLLLQVARDKKIPQLENRVLAIDYLGTLIGAVAFPLILLPFIGLTATAFLTGSLNGLASILILTFTTQNRTFFTMRRMAFCCVVLIGILSGLLNNQLLHDFIINQLFFMFQS